MFILTFVIGLKTLFNKELFPFRYDFFDFGKKLALLVFETIIRAPDEGLAITNMLQIADALDKLNNFHALACVVIALKQSRIKSHPVMQTISNKERIDGSDT